MIVPATYVDALVAFVFFFFSLAFFTLGTFAIGKGKPETAGTVFLVVGIITGIMGFTIINAYIESPPKVSVGLLVLMVACTFSVAGIVKLLGYDMVPLGNLCIISGLMMLAFAVFFSTNREIFSTIGWVWLTVNTISWALVHWTVTLVAYKKITPPTLGWIFIIQAFYSLFIPAALLLTGVISLKP